jgi:hypothetical protein
MKSQQPHAFAQKFPGNADVSRETSEFRACCGFHFPFEGVLLWIMGAGMPKGTMDS